MDVSSESDLAVSKGELIKLGETIFSEKDKERAEALFRDPNPIHERVVHGAAILGRVNGMITEMALERNWGDKFIIEEAFGAEFTRQVRWSQEYLVMLQVNSLEEIHEKGRVRTHLEYWIEKEGLRYFTEQIQALAY